MVGKLFRRGEKMTLNGETASVPSKDEIEKLHQDLFGKLHSLLQDPKLLEEAKCLIIDLEWVHRYYNIIKRSHGRELPLERCRAEYDRFYEKVFESYLQLKPYLSFKEPPLLNIPPKQGITYEKLTEHLDTYLDKEDDQGYNSLDLIKEYYPHSRNRLNKREKENIEKKNTFNKLRKSVEFLKNIKENNKKST